MDKVILQEDYRSDMLLKVHRPTPDSAHRDYRDIRRALRNFYWKDFDHDIRISAKSCLHCQELTDILNRAEAKAREKQRRSVDEYLVPTPLSRSED